MTAPPANIDMQPAVPKADGVRRRSAFLLDAIIIVAGFGDVLFFAMGLVLAFFARRELSLTFGNNLIEFHMPISAYAGHFVFGTVLYLALASRYGMYSMQKIVRFRQIFIAAMNTICLWALVYLFLSLLFSFRPPISRVYVTFGAIDGLAFVVLWRWLLGQVLVSSGMARRLRQRLVIVGWNLEVDRLARAIMNDAAHPYEIVGCLPSARNEYRMSPPKDVRHMGDYQEITEIHKREQIDIILIGDLDPNTREIIALCEFCQREMIQFKVVPTYFQILISGLHLETISGVPVLGIAKLPLDSLLNRTIKRSLDIVGAIVGLILASPIILIFGIIVYLESPGPVIYRQDRMGRGGRLFKICKIRSMCLDAEKDGAQRAIANDSRRLRIGAFMRKWNIDEVPQFWNVLKGEMSLVGPRPEILGLIEDLKDSIRHYNARHNVKPGITGWAQIHGLRGDTDLTERLRYDLFYLENWTPVLDIYIMLMTFRSHKNAY
ncbi:MAG: exopolysaccharide biosynthesis polyprenyl glycosylphosphotransferase [Methylacidiphilales bacterium]|nr:exopolysaccharide biosynthesis polyprenyl glycosylphosphotransferase [Candidatus Methylacidiphilales bacterium]